MRCGDPDARKALDDQGFSWCNQRVSDARVRIRLFEFEGPADAANLMLAAEGLTVKPAELPTLLPLQMAEGRLLAEPIAPRASVLGRMKKPPARKR